MWETTLKGATAQAAITSMAVELKCAYGLPIGMVTGKRVIHLRLPPAANDRESAINYADRFRFPGL
jgi:hypothetical protein